MKLTKTLAITSALCLAASAHAHNGRRLEIIIVDGQLAARGYNSAGSDDGGGVERAYYNALHDHWHFNPAPGVVAASADLPGFDLFEPGPLVGHEVTVTLIDAYRWVDPPVSPAPGTVPVFEPLAANQEVFASYAGDSISTLMPGTLTLIESASASGDEDIDVVYDVADEPAAQIFVLEFILKTDAPGVADSDTVHILFSPDGANPMEKRHHAALYTERFLGTPVCPADFDKDTDADPDDINAFVNAFVAGNADMDGDSDTDPDDIAAFVDAFVTGCN